MRKGNFIKKFIDTKLQNIAAHFVFYVLYSFQQTRAEISTTCIGSTCEMSPFIPVVKVG